MTSLTRNERYFVSIPGLQSLLTPVEGLVKLLHRMTSGGRLVDVCRRGTSVKPRTRELTPDYSFVVERLSVIVPALA